MGSVQKPKKRRKSAKDAERRRNTANNVVIMKHWVEYDIGTVEKLTLTAADRRINMSFMKISYSQGARN